MNDPTPPFVFALFLGLALLAPATSGGAELRSLSFDLQQEAPELDRQVLRLATRAASCARRDGLAETSILTLIDYSRPSTEPRLWVFDLAERRLLYRELVAHGRNSGENEATAFSNTLGSLQSSLGLFRTGGTYHGRNGYSLKLHGLEEGVNDAALERTIVIHGAPYVSPEFAEQFGRLGRSWGCPALPKETAREVIDTIKGGSLVFSYFPDEEWLGSSEFIECRDAPWEPIDIGVAAHPETATEDSRPDTRAR